MKTLLLALAASASILSAETPPAAPEQAPAVIVDEKIAAENRAKAKAAWDADQKSLGDKEFAEMEKDYQEINTNYKSPQVKQLLTQFIAKWKKGNRVGCATLYLAQKSGGAAQEALLKKCTEEFSDSYYLDGTQVGGLARLFLADFYKKAGKSAQVKTLATELRKEFPNAQDHSRRSITELLKAVEK